MLPRYTGSVLKEATKFQLKVNKSRNSSKVAYNKLSNFFLPCWESYRHYTSWVASFLCLTTTIPKVDAKPRTKGRYNLSRWMEKIEVTQEHLESHHYQIMYTLQMNSRTKISKFKRLNSCRKRSCMACITANIVIKYRE